MKALFTVCARYSRALLYGAWFHALSGLLGDRQYENFLRPEFGLLLGVGLLAIIAFLLSEMTRIGKASKHGFAGGLRGLLLIAPLAYLPIARGVALDAGAFDKRWTGLNGYDRATSVPLVEQAAYAVTHGVQSVTLADLCWDAGRYQGRRVVVEGMIKHVSEIAAEFGPNAYLLYRFVVRCCVADAMPVAVLLVGELPADSPGDTWIRAEGMFKQETVGRRDVIRLDLERATKEPRPRNPYLY